MSKKDVRKFLKRSSDILDKAVYGHKDAKRHLLRVLAQNISNEKSKGNVFGIQGPMGNGKTTLVKEIIFALGIKEKVKSPTFTIIEPYELNDKNIYHIDLYRINDPSELEIIGLREYLNESEAIIFIEWPEKSFGFLKKFDLKISLKHSSEKERKCKIELNP